ncbi:DUF2357 domain-containing protein [Parapedobacter sp. 2B3]|uniref:DUF2357 domain-containing protein n=1 Tax=Parapedobacter sp. 2B3 TaxID=3342381 RepID=UPI0035B5C332
MAAQPSNIIVPISKDTSVTIRIYSLSSDPDSIRYIYPEEDGISPYQLKEGYSYEYEIDDSSYEILINSRLNRIIQPSIVYPHSGRIVPNTYVGRLQLTVEHRDNPSRIGTITVEVRSSKTDYLTEYRAMLADITEYCTELLLHHNSPVSQQLISNFSTDAKTLYQRFAFVRSMVEAPEFQDAIHRILQAPTSTWKDDYQHTDIRRVKRITSGIVRQIAGSSNRGQLPAHHQLRGHIESVPLHITQKCRQEIFDTPENRFIKHVLMAFTQFAQDVARYAPVASQTALEANALITRLEQWLSHSFFRQIGKLEQIKLNSPVLQRKEGYREITRVWHMFDLAAKLIWQGGDDVYEAGKRDVATLYEYWLFFKLLVIFQDIFQLDDVDIQRLIVPTTDGMHLQLKAGRHIGLSGVHEVRGRKLRVEYSYNRSFSGSSAYPQGGSWTLPMRPDYTLSVWPAELSAKEAEEAELMVHLHFDAKYKVEAISELFDRAPEVELPPKQLDYKRVDLLKMHAYRDAIRRTAGAYILYPGNQNYRQVGYHELLPGLGAFHIRPSSDQSGLRSFKQFIVEVIDHLGNRASQQARLAHRVYDTFRETCPTPYRGWYPTFSNSDRMIPPQDVYVLVAYYKTDVQLAWIQEKLLYNLRLEGRGSENVFNPAIMGAKLLLLHGPNNKVSNLFFEIEGEGPCIFSNKRLVEHEYPSRPSQFQYLVFNIKPILDIPVIYQWDVRRLKGYQKGREAAVPFSITLAELMENTTA